MLFRSANANALANANANANALANANANALAYANVIEYLIACAKELAELPEVYRGVDFNLLITRLESLQPSISDAEQPEEAHQKFARDLIDLWLNTFNLTSELISLTESELAEIDRQYFYVNWLILQCKQSAVMVSPKTWQEIEERMLRVPNPENLN